MQSALTAVLLLVLVWSTPVHAAKRTVPQGWLGVMADGPLLSPELQADPLQFQSEFQSMAQTGVESVRFVISWDATQPYRDMAAVPAAARGHFRLVDGVPTDFSASDRLVGAAAAHGLRSLVVVHTTPPWARTNVGSPYSPPADPAAYGRFVGVLAHRYGPSGSFWQENPGLSPVPVRAWQIWNEPAGGATPNGPSSNWVDGEPFQRRYIAMLRASRAQIKAVDPGATVVLAGMFGTSWLSVNAVYAAGGRGLFDAAAINIFTRRVVDVVQTVRNVRAVLDRHRQKTLPIMLTEVTWPSSKGKVPYPYYKDYEVTPAAQAQRITKVLALLAAQRRKLKVANVFWYTWATVDGSLPPDPFNWAGLRALARPTYRAKPSQGAYAAAALKLEGCQKQTSALRCGP